MTPTHLRKADEGDLFAIMSALRRMLAKSPAPQMKYADPAQAEWSVKQAMVEGRAHIAYGYFIMVDIGCDWYSTTPYMIEQIIIRVYDTPFAVHYAVAVLDDIAAFHGVAITAVGDTQIGHMTPHYLDAGYQILGTQLVKEHAHGVRTKEDRGSSTD